MYNEDFLDDMDELVSAEDFLEFFSIPYDERVVNVNRLHILQRFHNYLSGAVMPDDALEQWAVYVGALTRAYQDFINSDAKTEKVLKVYQREAGLSFVNIKQIAVQGS